jgi:ADP-heptose:LPS heptosyltransferase
MLYSYPVKVNKMIAKIDSETTLRKICVIFPGALGDFVCFLPVLNTLAADAEVDLFARAEFADIVPRNVKVQSSESYEITQLFVAGAETEERLAQFFGRYACIYSWHGSQQPEFVRSLQSASKGRAHVFPFRPHAARSIHQADYYLSCIGKVSERATGPLIFLKHEATAWADRYWARHALEGKPVLALAPGSGAREKNWPVEYFQAVAQWWRDKINGAAIVAVGPVEEEWGGIDPLLNCSLVARNLNLAQLGALLARSDLYLGNDSGITHLAAAVGARTVALFGPSDVRQWAPRGKQVTILNRNVECSPCEVPVMKSCAHRKCLNGFLPEKIIAELENLALFANLTRGEAGIRV